MGYYANAARLMPSLRNRTISLSLADASDDFTGHLIPVDETKWDRYDTQGIYPACQSNVWRANLQGNPVSCGCKSLWKYRGDFLFEVDNDMSHIGGTTYGALKIESADDSTRSLYIFKFYASSNYFYRVDSYDPSQHIEANIGSVNDTVGQWRITRVGATTSVWYNDVATPSWTKIVDSSFFITEDDVRVSLMAYATYNSTMDARLDNFTTVSADMIIPV